MPTINGNTTIALDGVTPISVGGVQYYEWFDQFLDGAFFFAPNPGPVLTVNLSGEWNASTLRVSGQLAARINDAASGERRLEAILCRNEADDVITLTRTAVDVIRTGNGNDTVSLGGSFWVALLETGEGNDRVTLNNGRWLGAIDLGNGANRLVADDRGAGIESIRAFDGSDSITVRGGAGAIATGGGADVILTGLRYVGTINGGSGNDRITTGGDAQFVHGQDGNDIIATAAGGWSQVVAGEGGNDRLSVRGEATLIDGGDGRDVISTGAGWVGTIDSGSGADRVVLNRGGTNYVNLGRDADTLIVKAQADPDHRVIVAGSSSVSTPRDRDSDTVNLAAFRTAIQADLDSGYVNSNSGGMLLREIEHLVGGRQNDLLSGNHEDNRLSGGAGRDTLVGGAGADSLIGGAAADSFRFTSDVDSRADGILDFSRTQGDRIDLRGIDADESRGGDQNFAFLGARRFSGDEGELRAVRSAGQTTITGDTDGDRRADFIVILDDPLTMLERDFVL
ncbi:calcium-binding protein [Paracoccus spongiarum]|uniref:Calcium-binding protein n=1 Tax=Paracoccus spongiarum TaxID=3064387 RepID=A0ABT9JFJ4_9RHOB|nr:calcium-binding protein [Paracoccus sp. 2205BS29-5]MDP5308534.1 calcium-binding protein [Paracoccus sp. 2205BS29-5]